MNAEVAVPSSASSYRSDEDARVLIVEDHEWMATLLADALSRREYAVEVCGSVAEAHRLISIREPDLILLDLGLPDRSGMSLCRELRRWFHNPIIVITADGDDLQKVEALDAGADDYVTKPFSTPELMARVRAALRLRLLISATVDASILRVGDLTVDTGSRVATAGGAPLVLTRKELDLLALLARSPGRVIAHATILANVWGEGGGSTESLRVHVTNLRKKLGAGSDRPRIETEPGVGYRLVL